MRARPVVEQDHHPGRIFVTGPRREFDEIGKEDADQTPFGAASTVSNYHTVQVFESLAALASACSHSPISSPS